MKILVVDDEQRIRDLITQYLTIDGYDVEQAKDGIDALTKISKGDISFTITAIAKNAFKGCKKVSEVKIKTVNIKRIQKKALNGLNKKAKIRVPKSVLKAYKKMLKKSKYNVYKW